VSVQDANGQALAYVYSRDTEDAARQAKVLTAGEGRRIPPTSREPPVLLGKGEGSRRPSLSLNK
jgi:hypothetical protein